MVAHGCRQQRTPAPRSATCGRASGARTRSSPTSSTGCGWPCSSRPATRVEFVELDWKAVQIGSQRPACRPRHVGQGDDRTARRRRAGRARRSAGCAVDRLGCPGQAIPEQRQPHRPDRPGRAFRNALDDASRPACTGADGRALRVAMDARSQPGLGHVGSGRLRRRVRGSNEVTRKWRPRHPPGRPRRSSEASAPSLEDVIDLASRVDVLHVAAHGRHTADNPLFSGIELADGTLFGYDIDLVPQLPATVVLSACEVGRSSVLWGEEALGMTRIWLHAGTRCVIAAPVDRRRRRRVRPARLPCTPGSPQARRRAWRWPRHPSAPG